MPMKSLVAALFIAGTAGFAVAQEKKADTPAETKTIESKKEDRKPSCGRACFVNFPKELGLPFEYLSTLGVRIATARKSGDPVDLALAGQALAVAETAAGKTASVTSAEVFKEAIELAKLRNISSELSAVAQVVPDQATRESLTKAVPVAKKLEEEAKKKDPAEAARELHGNLYVTNKSGECMRIKVNGRYIGTVHDGQTVKFHIHNRDFDTVIEAECESGGDVHTSRIFRGHNHGTFYWTLR